MKQTMKLWSVTLRGDQSMASRQWWSRRKSVLSGNAVHWPLPLYTQTLRQRRLIIIVGVPVSVGWHQYHYSTQCCRIPEWEREREAWCIVRLVPCYQLPSLSLGSNALQWSLVSQCGVSQWASDTRHLALLWPHRSWWSDSSQWRVSEMADRSQSQDRDRQYYSGSGHYKHKARWGDPMLCIGHGCWPWAEMSQGCCRLLALPLQPADDSNQVGCGGSLNSLT